MIKRTNTHAIQTTRSGLRSVPWYPVKQREGSFVSPLVLRDDRIQTPALPGRKARYHRAGLRFAAFRRAFFRAHDLGEYVADD